MNASELLARIGAEPGKMGGRPVIRGRRITPSMVLTMLASGASREAVLEAYPVLSTPACFTRRGSARLPKKTARSLPNRVRLLADSNIVAQAVRAMRAPGHDVAYVGEWMADPGDRALLAEAAADRRVFLTKDHDIGALVHRDQQPAPRR